MCLCIEKWGFQRRGVGAEIVYDLFGLCRQEGRNPIPSV